MKRLIAMALSLAILMPAGAVAERLTFDVMPNVKIDAEVPDVLTPEMGEVMVEPIKIDADLAKLLLMPGEHVREDYPEGDVTFGKGDGASEYMLVETESGRICYGTAFYNTRLHELIICDDEMTDMLHYYPEDREVDGFPRAHARRQADELIEALGLQDFLLEPRALTLDTESYAVMLEDLSGADWQAGIPRVYLEPYDTAHDGYIFIYQLSIGGVPVLCGGLDKFIVFISREGIEYLETGFMKRAVSRADTSPVLTAGQALSSAVPQIEAALSKNATYVIGMMVNDTAESATIERVRLGYAFAPEGGGAIDPSRLLPVWEYSYLRAMWTEEGIWQTRTFDNPAFLGKVLINATTGEYLDTLQE